MEIYPPHTCEKQKYKLGRFVIELEITLSPPTLLNFLCVRVILPEKTRKNASIYLAQNHELDCPSCQTLPAYLRRGCEPFEPEGFIAYSNKRLNMNTQLGNM